MRKIETQMNEAVIEALNWKSGNTEVQTDLANNSRVFLHGNHIATVGEDFIQLFDGGFKSATTKSRLNALLFANGSDDKVFQKKGEWFVSTNSGTVKFTTGMILWWFFIPCASQISGTRPLEIWCDSWDYKRVKERHRHDHRPSNSDPVRC